MVADGIKDPISRDCRHQLLDEKRQKNSTDDGQNEVVHHEKAVEFEWFPIFHELSPGKDRYIV